MALLSIIKEEAFTALSEDFQKEYKKQDDGTFLLDVAAVGDFALENVKGLKSALSSERTKREALENKLREFDGLDVAKSREAIEKVAEMADWKPDEKVREQIGAIKSQLEEKHQKEVAVLEADINKFKNAAISSTTVREITDALAKHKGASYLVDVIEKKVKSNITDDGRVVTKVIDENGNARISTATGSQDLMTVEEFVAEMKADDTFSPAFEGSGATGSGATESTTVRTNTGQHVISRDDARDLNKYKAAKSAAEKAGTTLQIAEEK